MRFWLSVFAAVRYMKTFTAVLTTVLLASSLGYAQDGAPAPRPDAEFSFMQLLADKGEHNIENESWNAGRRVRRLS